MRSSRRLTGSTGFTASWRSAGTGSGHGGSAGWSARPGCPACTRSRTRSRRCRTRRTAPAWSTSWAGISCRRGKTNCGTAISHIFTRCRDGRISRRLLTGTRVRWSAGLLLPICGRNSSSRHSGWRSLTVGREKAGSCSIPIAAASILAGSSGECASLTASFRRWEKPGYATITLRPSRGTRSSRKSSSIGMCGRISCMSGVRRSGLSRCSTIAPGFRRSWGTGRQQNMRLDLTKKGRLRHNLSVYESGRPPGGGGVGQQLAGAGQLVGDGGAVAAEQGGEGAGGQPEPQVQDGGQDVGGEGHRVAGVVAGPGGARAGAAAAPGVQPGLAAGGVRDGQAGGQGGGAAGRQPGEGGLVQGGQVRAPGGGSGRFGFRGGPGGGGQGVVPLAVPVVAR